MPRIPAPEHVTMTRIFRALTLLAAVGMGTASCAPRQAAPAPAPEAAPRPAAQQTGPFRPYSDVVKEAAETHEGLFRVHRMTDTILFEIPREELGQEMLLLHTNIASTLQSPGGFFGAPGRMTVRWERQGNRIVLRQLNYQLTADPDSAIWRQVETFREGAVLGVFDIRTFGADSAAVIDVSDLFFTNIPDLNPIDAINRGRSWIDDVRAFPGNVNVEVSQSGLARPPGAPATFPMRFQTQRKHFSLYRLPDEPMMARWADDRIGWISSSSFDMSRAEHRADQVRFIHRHRLEKQDPTADVSDPVEPIIYWIDPATPEWMRPWIISGVDQWQPAFEEAGFSNAIFGRIAPTKEEDPSFSLQDARHHVIYWRPSTVANATGGQVVDPRSGEIIKGEVNMYHNIMELQKNWYFIQVSPLDVRAQQLPMPDSLMARLVEYVVAHEVGHAIGLPHNFKAAAMYPVDSIRSREFLERMNGHVATLMDYSRFNYVAQPEDNIPPHLLVPQVGPYDRFAIRWGYTPIPEARTPDEELPTLDTWARAQEEFPWLRFTVPGATADHEAQTEAVGNADAVRATQLGMLNLDRVVASLIPVAEVPGRNYDELNTLYGQAVGQWGRYMGHVAAIIGGAYSQETAGRGPRFVPLERERQQEAMAYLAETAFHVPEKFLDPAILRRIETQGAVERFRNAQASVLGNLFQPARLNRLIEFEALADRPADVYTLAEMVSDLRRGVWGEITASGTVRINPYRRNLQRAFLNAVDSRMNPTEAELTRAFNPVPQPWASDVRGVLRAELQDLDRLAQQALPRAGDAQTRIHLRDIRTEIARILEVDEE
ncbi:MAG: DUF5117 domain-containing protein [Gemmatimonadales bacterium]|nr:MAG: DUF5117 domain-containing protein [Gemmatimonadales bacterium]